MKTAHLVTRKEKEKVILVIIDYVKANSGWSSDEMYEEMRELVVACGGDVIDRVSCKIIKPTASYFISDGKLRDIANLCSMKEIDTVIFSHDLKGSQQRNLEEIVKIKTIDRTRRQCPPHDRSAAAINCCWGLRK